jgi:hypothetical protein
MGNEVTYEDLRYRLESEGEGYALKHYFGPDIEHEDENVVRLWKEAHDKLIELEDYVNKKCEEERSGYYELD